MTSRDRGHGLLTTRMHSPDLSFAILLELQDDKAPTASHGKARTSLSVPFHLRNVPDDLLIHRIPRPGFQQPGPRPPQGPPTPQSFTWSARSTRVSSTYASLQPSSESRTHFRYSCHSLSKNQSTNSIWARNRSQKGSKRPTDRATATAHVKQGNRGTIQIQRTSGTTQSVVD